MSAFWLIVVLASCGAVGWRVVPLLSRQTRLSRAYLILLSAVLGIALSGSIIVMLVGSLDRALPEIALISGGEVPCDPSYPEVCIPAGPPDLNCEDLHFVNFQVDFPDPHALDRDGNGVGCER